MSTVRASLVNKTRALLRPRLQSSMMPRPTQPASRRTYADDKTPAQHSSPGGVTPFALGLGLGIVGGLFNRSAVQKDVAQGDHHGQESYRTDKPGLHNMSVKDLDSSKDPAESDLPNDAPNNPANLDKMEQKQSQKPASKRSDPMK